MKGFCSGESIEIDLELDESEISILEREVIKSKIIRGHDHPPNFVDAYLMLGTTENDSLMGLKVLPEGADFEGTTGYEITLSIPCYKHLKRHGRIVDRPKLGTKISIYEKQS